MQQGGSTAHISFTASIIHSIRIANNIHNASITYLAVHARKRLLHDGEPVTLHRNLYHHKNTETAAHARCTTVL